MLVTVGWELLDIVTCLGEEGGIPNNDRAEF